MKYDLHTHTNYSDGDLDINGNVKRAIELNLDGIAITDHDNIDSWEEIENNNYPIPVIKGVEVTTYYKGECIHILGYYLNDNGSYQELQDTLKNFRIDRLKRLKKIVSLLNKHGINITCEEILKEADGAVARPHIAKAILKKYPERGFTKDEIFDRYIGNDAPCYVPVNNYKTEDAIKLLHDNHCLVVLAHPLQIKKLDYKELIDLGFDGIEGFYSYRDGIHEDVIEFGDLSNLIVTGGSDYHGPITRDSIGRAYLEDERLERFLKRINMEIKENNPNNRKI